MRNQATRKKLVLHRTTLRQLTTNQLRGVAGGRWNESRESQCDCPTFTCDNTNTATSYTMQSVQSACQLPPGP
jgi:hypothetical protein